MSLTFRALFDKIYPRKGRPPMVLFAGLDYGGKTTLLYLLKLGEIVTTIPSIGFNVETVDVPITTATAAGPSRTLALEGWDIGTGCAGYQRVAQMLRWYIPNAKAVVWVVDSTDRARLHESAEALHSTLLSADTDESGAPRPPIPILILANKSDLPGALLLDDVRKAFAQAVSGRIASVHRTSLTCTPPQGLADAFAWLALALDIAADGSSARPLNRGRGDAPGASAGAGGVSVQGERGELARRLEQWLRRTEEDVGPEEFLERFAAYDLPAWDHYTHIRIAYLILVGYGRQKGKDMIFDGLAAYIANNAHTNGRAFHVTMTYFWIQIVHFGIRNMPSSSPSATSASLASPPAPPNPVVGLAAPAGQEPGSSSTSFTSLPSFPSSAEFARFLLVNPHVVDGGLWADYYSRDVIMSPAAKGGMVLPDKKPLPSVVVRDSVRGGRG